VLQQYQSTLTLVTMLYGAHNHQVDTLLKTDAEARGAPGRHLHNFVRVARPVIVGVLRAMRADVDAGLVGAIGQRVAGEVLGDMLALAREALALGSDAGKNVAAECGRWARYWQTCRGDLTSRMSSPP
jgi:hypothetical protein